VYGYICTGNLCFIHALLWLGDQLGALWRLKVRQEGAHEGGQERNQAKGHCACAVAVVRGATVGACFKAKEGDTTLATG
jgi:hypothetical protein